MRQEEPLHSKMLKNKKATRLGFLMIKILRFYLFHFSFFPQSQVFSFIKLLLKW